MAREDHSKGVNAWKDPEFRRKVTELIDEAEEEIIIEGGDPVVHCKNCGWTGSNDEVIGVRDGDAWTYPCCPKCEEVIE